MGARALDDLPGRGGAEGAFDDDVIAVTLDVAVDDHDAAAQLVTDTERRKSLPLLARMEVAVQVGEVPIAGSAKRRRMEKQCGRERAAERRVAMIPGMIVAGAGDVIVDEFAGHFEIGPATIATDVDFLGLENFGCHFFSPIRVKLNRRWIVSPATDFVRRGASPVGEAMNPELRFRLGFGGEAFIEFGAREHRPAMSAVADFLFFVEGADVEFEPAWL